MAQSSNRRGLFKRVILVSLVPMWLAVPPFIDRMIAWHAKMIGGARYFAHMGVQVYIGTLYFLMATAVCIAISLLLLATTNRLRESLPTKFTSAFTIAALIAFLPAYTNGISLIRTTVFPFQMRSEVFALLGLALFTTILLFAVSPPSENTEPREKETSSPDPELERMQNGNLLK